MKCLNIKQEMYFLLNNLGSKQSVNQILPTYVILQKKTFYKKIQQKLQRENYFQILLCLQNIKQKLYLKMKLLKQATYIICATAKLSSKKGLKTSFQAKFFIDFFDKFYLL